MHYATLYQVKQYLGLGDDNTQDDSKLVRFINQSVGEIVTWKERRFDVRYATMLYDVPVSLPNPYGEIIGVAPLRLKDDLLSLVTLTNGDGTTIAAANYVVEPANKYPKSRILLFDTAWELNSSGSDKQVISAAGYWGYHTDYTNAWEDSLDTVEDNPLSSGATTITVNDVDGVAGDGSEQRFQAGQMLRIDDEFVYLAAVNTIKNTLTVKRAYNGTTAAAHNQNAVIKIYRPMENIVLACTRLVAWRYRQKDADAFDATTILGTGIQVTPSAMPADIKRLLGAKKAQI